MLDFGVGRTKRSAVPAGVWQLPERRYAWSGLPRNKTLKCHQPHKKSPALMKCRASGVLKHAVQMIDNSARVERVSGRIAF